jgi:ElaB/YqjD/DUF883 family membrane-anchored ribosome-binding protein
MKLVTVKAESLKYLTISLPKPTPEMVRQYRERTSEHINRVRKNLKKIAKKYGKRVKNQPYTNPENLSRRGLLHDKSKYSDMERIPCIWLTWYHYKKNKDEDFIYPPGVERVVKKANRHHVNTNRHHPEYHASPTDMTYEDLSEMVADWAAMSQELGTSLREWVKANLKNWDFKNEDKRFINELVKMFDDGGDNV